MEKYRHEFKFLCSDLQLAVIENNIKSLTSLDKHAANKGFYLIRSIYFDDCFLSCYHDVEDGNDPRQKFRIRTYNNDTSFIHLELKKKKSGKTRKESCTITKEQCDSLIVGRPAVAAASSPPVLHKLCALMRTSLLNPTVIVEYERTPFVYQNGNVRVTFDRKLVSSSDTNGFYRENIKRRPVLPAGQNILEVKYDEYLPDYLKSCLQIDNLQQISFSKYYLCRRLTV